MITFQLGVANGEMLALSRAPAFLRAVQDEDGSIDALDQLEDAPRDTETCYAYRLASDVGHAHVDFTDKGKRVGKWLLVAHYMLAAEQPEQSTMVDTAQWRAWATLQANHEKKKPT